MAGMKRSADCLSSDSSGGSTVKKSKGRQVIKSTFDKWQREHEREHRTLTWLRCELDRDRVHVASLFCAACRKYERYVCSLKNFSSSWIEGSTNLKLSNMLDHARSEVHKAAMSKLSADSAKERGESLALNTPIGRSLFSIDQSTRDRLKLKFDICYTMAKENLAFAKYPALLELEAHHGADMGFAYGTPESAKTFTRYIARSQRQSFLNMLSSSHTNFFSFLIDGTTDSGNQEDELIIVVYCSRNNLSEELTVCTRYLSVNNPERANAEGLYKCVAEALKIIGIEALNSDTVLGVSDMPVLVGGGSDGAIVNVSDGNGLKGMIQRCLPWLYWSWCYAHRLELACKDAFSSNLYSHIEEMLLRLYYVYEKSPKKSKELNNIVDDLKEVFHLPKGGNLPVRSQGTRWITHKRKALQRVLDRYGTYIAHLTSLVDDSSVRTSDRDRLKGYLRKWKQPKMIIATALYIEVLKPASILSQTLQSDDVDIVFSIESILKTLKALQTLSEKDPKDWPTLQLVKNRIDYQSEYQGVSIDFETVLDICTPDSLADLHRLEQKIKDRLQWSNMHFLRSVLVFLETQCWLRKENRADTEETSNDDSLVAILTAVDYIISIFRAPLEAKGMCIASIQDELEEIVDYARKYLPLDTLGYRKVWFKLHTCLDSQRWPNVLLLSELLFSLPFTTSRVEQIFSRLKNVKTKLRTSLDISTLHDLLEICIEGPSLQSFDVNSAIDMWWKDCNTVRRPNQQKRKNYQPRQATSTTTASSSTNSESNGDESETVLFLDDWDKWLKE